MSDDTDLRTMCDDIDIEEHDVLDDPAIRRIFPDLSIIKKEISEYEEGSSSILNGTIQDVDVDVALEVNQTIQQDVPKISEIRQQPPMDHRLEVHQRFKTFFDSLNDDDFENTDFNSDPTLDTNQQYLNTKFDPSTKLKDKYVSGGRKDGKCFQNNIFILGSKPNLKPHKTKTKKKQYLTTNRQLKIVLQNVSSNLYESGRFCKHCLILFPTFNALMYHTSKIHDSKTSNVITKKTVQLQPKSSNTKYPCRICSVSLSSKGNLVRHIKTVHEIKKPYRSGNIVSNRKNPLRSSSKSNKTKMSVKERVKIKESPMLAREASKTSKSDDSHACFHCSETFESMSSLIEHLYSAIKPNNVDSEHSSSKKAQINERKNVDVDDKNINSDELLMDNIECSECTIKFSTQSELDEHNKEKHLSNKPFTTSKNEVSNSPQNSDKSTNNKSRLTKSDRNLDKPRKNYNHININDKSEPVERRHSDASHGSPDCKSITSSKTNTDDSVDLNKKIKEVYQCFICSQYITYYKGYSYHMCCHNINETSEIDKKLFEPQCKFCPFKLPSIHCYNNHVVKFHRNKLIMKWKLDERAFQSILFKCAICDVFFLSMNAAKSHSEHKKICINWKCLQCERLFKFKDKLLHMKQHTLSKDINAYDLCEAALRRVLFKCLKCAVNFSEVEYFLHYNTGDCEIPDSAYCNICDALINKNDMALHEDNHTDKRLQLYDFTFIESDIMINEVKKTIVKKKKPVAKSELALTFCHTCKCFIYDLNTTRKVHIEKRCSAINSRMCRKCGLIFTSRGYVSHKWLHDKIENLSLQSYYFYDIKSKKQMRPPIPIYPKCDICDVHFLNKQHIKEHQCSQQHYTKCKICNIKLTEAAFNLHKNYHDYKLESCANNEKSVKLELEKSITSPINKSLDHDKSTPIQNEKHDIAEPSAGIDVSCLFTCMACHITVDTYDKVIEHCHEHYDYYKDKRTNYQTQIRKKDDKTAISVNFDPFYLRFTNDVWIKHIFANVSENIINNILANSIYQNEARFKMEEIQKGPLSLVLYKCDTCQSYIEPNALYVHAKNPCTITNKHPCSICGLSFDTSNYQKVHEKLHNIYSDLNTNSYIVILYNKTEHKQFTRAMIESRDKFILYQCRNCECIADKLQRGMHQCKYVDIFKCPYCGLLFCEQEVNSHIYKHKKVLYFDAEHIIVIMFGKLGSQKYNKQKPSFHGTIYDLTFYKCINCSLCLTSKGEIAKHICVSKSSKTQCPKCGLNFLKKELHEHFKVHANNLELGYDDFNSNIITFDLSNFKVDTGSKLTNDSLKLNEKETNAIVNTDANVIQKIYKCPCGLHFLEDLNARKHFHNCSPRQKISKQSCFKCDLLFTPGELFDHLLKHHGNKKTQYKYDIINIKEIS